MARRESLSVFIKNFKNYGIDVQKSFLKQFNIRTIDVLGLAQSRTPVVTGDLEGSGSYIKARVTNTGIRSAIVFKMPYANKIENGDVNLAPEGTVYNTKKGKKTKRRLGQTKYASSAIEDKSDDFLNALENVIDMEFNRA